MFRPPVLRKQTEAKEAPVSRSVIDILTECIDVLQARSPKRHASLIAEARTAIANYLAIPHGGRPRKADHAAVLADIDAGLSARVVAFKHGVTPRLVRGIVTQRRRSQ